MVHVDDAQVSPYDHTYHTQGEKTMRAVIITRPGGHEVLAIQDVEMPEPTGDQVRVRVHAAGLKSSRSCTKSWVLSGSSGCAHKYSWYGIRWRYRCCRTPGTPLEAWTARDGYYRRWWAGGISRYP